MLMRMEMEMKEMSLIFGDNIQIKKLKAFCLKDTHSFSVRNITR